jgi:hypothetical protein
MSKPDIFFRVARRLRPDLPGELDMGSLGLVADVIALLYRITVQHLRGSRKL